MVTTELQGALIRVFVLVQAGIGREAIPDYDKQWAMTNLEWERDGLSGLAKKVDEAQAYSLLLMLRPEHVTWVRTDLEWL